MRRLYGCLALGLAACAPSADTQEATAELGADTPPQSLQASTEGAIPGTPDGGLEQWVGEIRSGIASLPGVAVRDPAGARNTALNLYMTRQEFIELYYGTTARAVSDAELNEAVMTAETRFHDLLRVVNTPDGAIDTAALRATGEVLDEQYGRVLERARALGVDLTRPVPAGAAQ